MDEISAWQLAFWQRRGEIVAPLPWGAAVLTPTFRSAHDHNKLMVSAVVDASAVAAEAELALEGCSHRRIEVGSSALADGLEPGLVAAGYTRDDDLVMELTSEVEPRGDTEVLGLKERALVASAEWERDQPGWEPQAWLELGRRAVTATVASDATFLGIRDDQGRVVARTDLFVFDGIAQVEEVMTDPAHQGQGLASRLVTDAVVRARAAGARRVFLVADVDDWPQQLYRRLGFSDLGRSATFSR